MSGSTHFWLFGSYASGNHTPRSDVDLAVLPAGKLSFRERLELAAEYAAALDVDRLDLLDIQQVDAVLRQHILSGHLIFERNPDRVNSLIEVTINELRHNAYRREQALRDYLQSLQEAYRND